MMVRVLCPIMAMGWVVAGLWPALADPVFPRTSSVGLEAPAGMTVANGFLGFQKEVASILVVDLPKEAFAQIAAKRAAFAAALQNGTATDYSTASGLTGFLVRGNQTAESRMFRKWILVLNAPDETAMLTAQVPVDDEAIEDASIDAALKSVVVRARPALDAQIAALPYMVSDPAGFRATSTLAGEGLMLTDGPLDVDPEGRQPHVVVATSLNRPAEAGDRLAFARRLLDSFKAVRMQPVTQTKMFQEAGAQWAELEGAGLAGPQGQPVDLSFFVRFGPDDYVMVVATAPAGQGSQFAARFHRIARSVKPRQP